MLAVAAVLLRQCQSRVVIGGRSSSSGGTGEQQPQQALQRERHRSMVVQPRIVDGIPADTDEYPYFSKWISLGSLFGGWVRPFSWTLGLRYRCFAKRKRRSPS